MKLILNKLFEIIYGLRVLIIIITLIYVGLYFSYRGSKKTCGQFVQYSSVRGGRTVIFNFTVHNQTYIRSIDASLLKKSCLDSIEDYKCVEIEYSVYIPSLNSKVVDKRVIKD